MGYLPTKLKTSQRIMNLIAIFGAGLLVGAALVVIIPEGMLVLFQSIAQTKAKNDSIASSNSNNNEDDHSTQEDKALSLA